MYDDLAFVIERRLEKKDANHTLSYVTAPLYASATLPNGKKLNIDFKAGALPDAPPGSDADRIARGLPPLGRDGARLSAPPPSPAQIAETLGLPPGSKATVRDLWNKVDLGTFTGRYPEAPAGVQVKAHGVELLRITAI